MKNDLPCGARDHVIYHCHMHSKPFHSSFLAHSDTTNIPTMHLKTEHCFLSVGFRSISFIGSYNASKMIYNIEG